VASILEEQQQLLLSQWRGDEAKTVAEARAIIVDGMRQHRPNAGLVRNQHRATNRILQQADADAASVVLRGGRQSRQNHHRYGILPHPFADSLGRFQRINLANGQAEIACAGFFAGFFTAPVAASAPAAPTFRAVVFTLATPFFTADLAAVVSRPTAFFASAPAALPLHPLAAAGRIAAIDRCGPLRFPEAAIQREKSTLPDKIAFVAVAGYRKAPSGLPRLTICWQ